MKQLLTLPTELTQAWNCPDLFSYAMQLQGEVFRDQPGRKTLRFISNGDGYFIKIHTGVGWREIFKNLLYLRIPILGAKNEWQAIQRLQAIGIDTTPLVGYGSRGNNPARQQSFVITRELTDMQSLEDLAKQWVITPPSFLAKRALIREIARIARLLHSHGGYHRDFYICHFLLPNSILANLSNKDKSCHLFLIDLHRMQWRRRPRQRWLIKDIAGLYFSTLGLALNRSDYFYFIQCYRECSAKIVLRREAVFWQAVNERAQGLWDKHKDVVVRR